MIIKSWIRFCVRLVYILESIRSGWHVISSFSSHQNYFTLHCSHSSCFPTKRVHYRKRIFMLNWQHAYGKGKWILKVSKQFFWWKYIPSVTFSFKTMLYDLMLNYLKHINIFLYKYFLVNFCSLIFFLLLHKSP